MTNEEINALSDQQINVMMTATIKKTSNYKVHSEPNGDYVEFLDCVVKVDDYCNDPAVMMPVVFENGIELSPSKFADGVFTWQAGYFMVRVVTKSTNNKPYRAAAIVYLKMKGVL